MSENDIAGLTLAIYARVSTEEQREGQTIDSQVSELERFAREKGWLIAGTYKDAGWSGGVMERPELDRLRDDALKGMFEAVLINDVDRLARDVAHLGVIKRDLERKGIKVIFRKLPSDTSPTYNLMVNILGSFAEFEREMISDRTRRGRRHKVETRKQYLGSNTAFGYHYTPMNRITGEDGILAVAPQEAAVVQQMFQWVDQEGLSARRVLNRLNELRIPPKNGAPTWAKSSVLRILHCETYAGVWHYNKFQGCEPKNTATSPRYRRRAKCSIRQRPRSEWLPLELPTSLHLVPRSRWERVQQQLAHNLTFSPRNEKHAYLLKGLLRCGGCGARYVGDPCHGRFYYRCFARCKERPSVIEDKLNDAVKGAVKRVMLNPALILEPLQALDQAEAVDQAQRRTSLHDIQKEERQLAMEEQRLLDAYRTGLISPAQLGQQLEALKSKRAANELRRSEFERHEQVPPEKIERAVTGYCSEAAKNLSMFTSDEWREFLRTIIQVIVFDGDRIKIQARIPVETGQAAVSLEARLARGFAERA